MPALSGDLAEPKPPPGLGPRVSMADVEFQTDVLQAMALEHVDFFKLSLDEQAAIMDTAWADPFLQDQWRAQATGQIFLTSSQFYSVIRGELFSPQTSQDQSALDAGLALKAKTGAPLTTTQQNYLGAGQSAIPSPFDPSFSTAISQGFGAPSALGGTEVGIDYEMPVGQVISSPFAGTVHLEDKGKDDWGKRVLVVLDNGYTFGVGHLSSFEGLVDGQRIQPGDLIGLSGGDPGDPSSGESTGPHVEVQWITPDGQFSDPSTILNSIFKGTTFTKLGLPLSVAGQGVTATQQRQRKLGILDPTLEAVYSPIAGVWKQYFSREPTTAQLRDVIAHTGNDVQQAIDYVRAMPSHIQGMNVGQYSDGRGLVDNASSKLLGHLGTDTIVKELFDKGRLDPGGVNLFYTELGFLPGKDIPVEAYNAIHAANQPYVTGILNEPPGSGDPRIYRTQHPQPVPIPNSEAAASADAQPLPLPPTTIGRAPGSQAGVYDTNTGQFYPEPLGVMQTRDD